MPFPLILPILLAAAGALAKGAAATVVKGAVGAVAKGAVGTAAKGAVGTAAKAAVAPVAKQAASSGLMQSIGGGLKKVGSSIKEGVQQGLQNRLDDSGLSTLFPKEGPSAGSLTKFITRRISGEISGRGGGSRNEEQGPPERPREMQPPAQQAAMRGQWRPPMQLPQGGQGQGQGSPGNAPGNAPGMNLNLPTFEHGGQMVVPGDPRQGPDTQLVAFHATPGETVEIKTPEQNAASIRGKKRGGGGRKPQNVQYAGAYEGGGSFPVMGRIRESENLRSDAMSEGFSGMHAMATMDEDSPSMPRSAQLLRDHMNEQLQTGADKYGDSQAPEADRYRHVMGMREAALDPDVGPLMAFVGGIGHEINNVTKAISEGDLGQLGSRADRLTVQQILVNSLRDIQNNTTGVLSALGEQSESDESIEQSGVIPPDIRHHSPRLQGSPTVPANPKHRRGQRKGGHRRGQQMGGGTPDAQYMGGFQGGGSFEVGLPPEVTGIQAQAPAVPTQVPMQMGQRPTPGGQQRIPTTPIDRDKFSMSALFSTLVSGDLGNYQALKSRALGRQARSKWGSWVEQARQAEGGKRWSLARIQEGNNLYSELFGSQLQQLRQSRFETKATGKNMEQQYKEDWEGGFSPFGEPNRSHGGSSLSMDASRKNRDTATARWKALDPTEMFKIETKAANGDPVARDKVREWDWSVTMGGALMDDVAGQEGRSADEQELTRRRSEAYERQKRNLSFDDDMFGTPDDHGLNLKKPAPKGDGDNIHDSIFTDGLSGLRQFYFGDGSQGASAAP